MNKKLVQSVRNSIPWLIALLGIILIAVGEFLNFFDSDKDLLIYGQEKFNHLIIEVGKVILVSGVASITLDSLKYLGIYNEELIKLLFDTKFLANRKDLPEYWEKVTKELLKDKFPKINNDILADVKDMYLPTSSIKYSENHWQHNNIELVDRNNEIVEITQTTKYKIIPVENAILDPLYFTNTINHGGNQNIVNYELISFSVNGIPKQVNVDNTFDSTYLNSNFSVSLDKAPYYEIERVIKKRYSLKNDCIMAFNNNGLMHNSTVQFQLKGVSLEFHSLGTIKDYVTKTQNDSLIVKEYVGLIYKNQGYVTCIKKK